MSEFKKVQSAERSPTQCALCHAHEGPFIDTGLLLPVYGHVYICMANDHRSGCIQQMARLDGMVEAQRYTDAVADISVLEGQLAEVKADLEESKVVPMAEVVAYFASSGIQVQEITTASNATVRTRRKPKEE